jgi:H+/Cl- antiporter ClcA
MTIGAPYVRLVALSALIGIPAALLAAVFLALVHELEALLWEDLPDHLGASGPPWYLIVGLPVVGSCIVAFVRRALPGDGGHVPLDGLDAAPTPISYGPGVALAALGSLPFGAVLGPEAPLIALGSVCALALTRFARLEEQGQSVVAMAGSFSAIAALFGGPIVAGVLLVEAGAARMGAALLPVLLPGLVAAAVGYLVFVGLGDWGGIDQAPLTVPGLPAYEGTHLLDLLVAIAIGVVAALIVAAIRRGGAWIAGPGRTRIGMTGLLVAGGAAVGLLALGADALGGDSQDVLFSGQAAVPDVVTEGSATVVLVLLTAKALAYAISLACGFRGGPVFPAVFVGVALATFPVLAFDVSPTLAVAAGTAAGMTAVTRLLFAPLVFATLLVGTNGLDAVPAAVLATAAAWIVTMALADDGPAAAGAQPPATTTAR